MKRIFVGIFMFSMFFTCSNQAFSAEEATEKGREEKAYTNTAVIYFDWIKTPTKDLFRQCANIFAVSKSKLGAGIDLKIGNDNFTDIRPYVTYAIADSAFTAITGYKTVSNGDKFVQYGLRYAKKLSAINLFIDARNYSAVSALAKDYSDVFVDVLTPVSNRFSAGIDFEHVHQWNGKADILFIGPVLNTKLGGITMMTRPEYERHWLPGKVTNGCNVRVAFIIPF